MAYTKSSPSWAEAEWARRIGPARFAREAQTLASLNHPNIAQIFGLEDPSGTGQAAAIAMELVEGEDLAARIRRGPVPLDEVWPLARQVAEALGGAAEATPYDLSNSPTLTARATQNRC